MRLCYQSLGVPRLRQPCLPGRPLTGGAPPPPASLAPIPSC